MDAVLKSDIVTSLRRLLISPGACVMVHSSLSSLGYVEGGADTVIDTFLEIIGPSGTLVMPAFCQKERKLRFERWDIASSPSDVGRITEVFRLRPESLRSDHATHSVACQGPLALSITACHRGAVERPGPWGPAAFGIGSPYDHLYALEAKIVLVGVDFRFNTLVHYIEHLMVESVLKGVSGDARANFVRDLRGWNQDGIWPSFDRMRLQERLLRYELLRSADCGRARLLMCPVKETIDTALAWMQDAPEEWFDHAFLVWMDRILSTPS